MTRQSEPMAEHVKQLLIAAGKLTSDGLGQSAQLRTCPRCGRLVLVGIDHRRCGLVVTCDLAVLTPYGEAAAILGGRKTYELWGKELERRDQFKIRGGMRKPVLGAHDCGNAPSPSTQILQAFIPTKPTTPKDMPCPF